MKKYDFDKIVDRSGTHTVKYDFRKQYFGSEDVIPMWVADMDFETPDFITDAVKKRAEHPIYGYTIRPESFNNALVNWMKDRHQWEIQSEWISFSPGVVPGLVVSILAFTNPGDKIMIQSPVYFPFYSSILGNGRQLVDNPLILNNGKYEIDFEDLESKIDSRTKMFLLCSPHNPVSRVWTKEELIRLGEICSKHNVLIVADEIHHDLVFKHVKHVPLASLSEELAQNTITFVAPSKTFNIAGLGTAAVIIPNKRLLDTYNNILGDFHLFISNVFGTTAFEAAYTFGHDWLDQLMEYMWENYLFVKDFLEKNIPQVKVLEPEGTYLLWLDFRAFNLDNKELKELLINKAKVGFNDGAVFGETGDGFQRMNIACSRKVIEKALQNMKGALA
jgi:cysteine-S-conjugate beta-lyase